MGVWQNIEADKLMLLMRDVRDNMDSHNNMEKKGMLYMDDSKDLDKIIWFLQRLIVR